MDGPAFHKADTVWFDAGAGYSVPGEVVDVDSENDSVQVINNEGHVSTVVDLKKITPRQETNFDQEDLIQLKDDADAAYLWTLKKRYENKRIYTYIGGVLLAVNPNENLSIYDAAVANQYKNQVLGTLPAHLFALGDHAYSQLLSTGQNQSIIFSGESASGKTENFKQLLSYLMETAPTGSLGQKRPRIRPDQMTAVQTVLESFGHARTMKNNNASRFGNVTELLYKQGALSGFQIKDFLLEKSRVIMQNAGERNFHIFYELCAGLPSATKTKFGIKSAQNYFYLNQGKCLEIAGRSDEERFTTVQNALDTIGFSQDQQHTVFRVLAAILHLGNVFFRQKKLPNEQEAVELGGESEINWVAYLLQIDPDHLRDILTTKDTEVKSERAIVPLDINQALDVRDELAQLLYGQLFSWLVQRISQLFFKPDKDASISLVDFYGFEKYNNNGYEQLCINLANERLHAYFYQTVFKSEQAEYLREHIEWDSQIGSHLDNRRVVDLLTKRPSGILPLLDDECKFPKGSDESFLQKCHLNHLDKSIYGKPRNREKPEFAVKHYAGMTWYTVTGFLDKNRQVILPKAVELFTESQNTTVSQIFAGFMRDQLKAKQNTPITKYVASNFNEALTQLMEKLTMSNPQFVRCIRPNLEKVPHKFDLQLVGQQLRALGVTDTVRMRKRGYPVRFTFAKFVGRYRSILPTSVKGKEEKESVKDILLQQGHRYAQDSQIGETTVFMKEGMAEHLERSREAIATRAAVVIQKYARGSVLRRKYSRKRLAATTLQAGVRGWIARKRCAAKKVELYRDVGEQAKQSKRLQMYEELRKNHEDAEAVNNNQARDHVVTAVEYLDMPDDLVSLMKTAGDHQEKPMTKVYGDFIEHNPHMALPKDLNTMSIEEFAKQHIKGHIFEMRREPIATPFLPKSSDADFHDSLRIFKLILRYMNDSTLKEGQDALLADYIVQMALSQPAQRDEVFVQLCNQTYKNQKEKNAERGWCLMALCAAAFAPSDMLFKPLLSYVQSHADVWKDTLTNCLLRRYCAETNTDRAFPPCSLEQMALRQKLRPVVEAQFADGTVFSAELDSWSTAEEVAERCLRARGIGEPEGWTVGVDAAELCVHTAGTDYLLDILSRLELPANFPASEIPFVISNGRRGDPLHHYHQFQADDEKARKSPSDQSSVPSEPKPERKGASPPRHAGHSPESEPMSAMSGSTLNRRYLQQRSADDQRTHANGPPADPKRGPSVPMQSPPAREHRAPTVPPAPNMPPMMLLQQQQPHLQQQQQRHPQTPIWRQHEGQQHQQPGPHSQSRSQSTTGHNYQSHPLQSQTTQHQSPQQQRRPSQDNPPMMSHYQQHPNPPMTQSGHRHESPTTMQQHQQAKNGHHEAARMQHQQQQYMQERSPKMMHQSMQQPMHQPIQHQQQQYMQERSPKMMHQSMQQPMHQPIQHQQQQYMQERQPKSMQHQMMTIPTRMQTSGPPPVVMPPLYETGMSDAGSSYYRGGHGTAGSYAVSRAPSTIQNGEDRMDARSGYSMPQSAREASIPATVPPQHRMTESSVSEFPPPPPEAYSRSESRAESFYGRGGTSIASGDYGHLGKAKPAPSDYSVLSVSSRIRRMQIPSKNSDVDKFLDAVFEQVLQPHDTPYDDVFDSKSIAASIKGGDRPADISSPPPMQMTQSFAMGNGQQMGQQQPFQYVSYPSFGGVQQPVMMMMPMDGRMFGMNPASWQMDNQQNYQQSFVFQHNGQQQQQAVNGSQGSQQQQQQQHYAPPMSPTPTVFQPVIIPSFIPNMMPMMACMSPTPSSVTCVSPLTVRADAKDPSPPEPNYPAPAPQPVLPPQPMFAAPLPHIPTDSAAAHAADDMHDDGRPSMTMVIRSTPPPYPTAADGGSAPPHQVRIGKMRSTSREARYVNPTPFEPGLNVSHDIRDVIHSHHQASPAPIRREYYPSEPHSAHSDGIASPVNRSDIYSEIARDERKTMSPEVERRRPQQHEQVHMQQADASAFDPPMDRSQQQPGRLPHFRFREAQRELEKEALEKLRENSKHLPPPVDEVRLWRAPRRDNLEPTPDFSRLNPRRVSDRPRDPPAPPAAAPHVPHAPHAQPRYVPNDVPPPPPAHAEPAAIHTRPMAPMEVVEWITESDVVREPQVERRVRNIAIDDKHYMRPSVDTNAARAPHDPDEPFEHQNGMHSPPLMDKSKKKPQALTYTKAPWELTVRKELFFPHEELDDAQELDLVFYQVIKDCRKSNPFRIRNYERETIMQMLRQHRINVDSVNFQQIPSPVKLAVVETARQWPLYFCRLYPVVEDRKSEYVSQLLGVGESGVRLVARNYDSIVEPLKILDHFDFTDLAQVEVPEPRLFRLLTRQGIEVRVFSDKAEQIKALVERYLFGQPKGKHFVRAISDYVTKQKNLLSFKRGEVIQLIKRDQMTPAAPDSAPNVLWLYGKIDNRYGNFPADYAEPIGDDHDYGVYGALGSSIYMSQDAYRPATTAADDYMLDESMMDEQWVGTNGTMPTDGSASGAKGKFTMMEFAMMYFRQGPGKHGQNGDTRGLRGGDRKKKEWTWKDIADQVKYTPTPINHSLLRLESAEYDKMAQEGFMCIMRYMGDQPLKKGQTLTDCVYELLMICHRHPPMRDELYCQIIRQTTNNKSQRVESAIRGWRLFSIMTAYFDCSEVLKPYLMKYLSEAAGDTRRAYHGTALVCHQHLKKTFKYGGRKFLLGAKEVEATTLGKNLKRQIYHLPGGHKKVINTKAVTVVEEIIQDLCQELNIRSSSEQQEFCLCYILEAENAMKLLANDEYILDTSTELEHKQKEYFLLLKRTVWIHPLRLDNDLYIDVMFFQLVPDYLEGLLVVLRSADTVSAALMDDIARLGALLHFADEDSRPHNVNPRTVNALLPRIVQNLRHVTMEQWADRVNRKIAQLPPGINPTEARARFLEVLQAWPLFGSTFFYITNVSDPRVQGECLLAINRHGLQFLHIITHETLAEFRLSEVMSTHKFSAAPPSGGQPVQFLDLKVGNLMQQRVITLQTDQGTEVSRLLGQYIYVDSQNRGFINGGESNGVAH